jgi:hypothetical protein
VPACIAPQQSSTAFLSLSRSLASKLPRTSDSHASPASYPFRLLETALADIHSSGEEPAGEHPGLMSLLDDRLAGGVCLCGKFWLVNLKVEPLQALNPSNELGLRNPHCFLP